MLKKILSVIVVLCVLFVCAGCNTSMAYTFSVDTGESVKVKLDTTDNYKISSDHPFVISCDGNELTHGFFDLGESYEQYVEVVKNTENAELIESSTKDNCEYIFWYLDGDDVDEYNYAILLDGGKTCVVLANAVSEESAKEVFGRLTFEVDGD